ncbi:MAG: diguanylate cyclase [bacterium]
MERLILETGELINDRYLIQSKLGEGGMSVVYKVEDIKNTVQLAMKLLKPNIMSSSVEDVIRFKQEMKLISALKHENLLMLHGVGEYKNIPYLITELVEEKRLEELLDVEVLKIDQILNIMIQLAEVLKYVHSKGIIHRDIKPTNIIIGKSKNEYKVKLIDFGIALMMELGAIHKVEQVVGTFGYMSPETMGIVNRRVDERSDLYSLGIIFYKLITGELPFKAKEISKLLHSQAAVVPRRPAELRKGVHKTIDDIVMQLLYKEPELRYQSAAGLLHDLKRFKSGEENFVVGEKDQKVKLSYQTRLVGREAEIEKIKKIYQRARVSRGSICLIGGESGIGKSRLGDELKTYTYTDGGVFISGRCIEQENMVSFQPFRDAINEYISVLDRLDIEDRELEISRIKNVLGNLTEIIVKLNPRLSSLFGKVEKLEPLAPEREGRRLLMTVSIFFRNLIPQEMGPCVLFLDDLQWADKSSLNLLSELSEEIGNSNLLIFGTYRNNEVGEDHPLAIIKNKAKQKDYSLEDIMLNPFHHEQLNEVTAAILGVEPHTTHNLTYYLIQKSNGNPFFAITLLRGIVEQGCISWKQGVWEEDWEHINSVNVSANMVDIVLMRVKNIGQELDNLLRIASAIGMEIDINALFLLAETSKEEVVRQVNEAVDIQLLEWSKKEKSKLIFVHERIKAAFYKKMEDWKKRQYHLKIAEFYEKKNQGKEKECVFELVHHYLEGDNKDKVLEYAVLAAEKSREDFAHENSLHYYKLVIQILEEQGRARCHAWMKAKEGIVEVYLLIGRNDEAIEVSETLLNLEQSILEKARIYSTIATAYYKKGDWQHCEDSSAKGLELLDDNLPRSRSGIAIPMLKELLIHFIHSIAPKYYYRRKKQIKPEDIVKSGIYLCLTWMFILTDTTRLAYVMLKSMNLSESNLGLSKELVNTNVAYGFMIGAVSFFSRAIKVLKRTLEIKKELHTEFDISRAITALGYMYLWNGDYKLSLDYLIKAKENYERIGDVWELAQNLIGLGHVYRYLGEYEKSIDIYKTREQICEKIKDEHGVLGAIAMTGCCYMEQGKFREAENLLETSLKQSEYLDDFIAICYSKMYLGYLAIEKQDYPKAIHFLEGARKVFFENSFVRDVVIELFAHLAEAYLEDYKIRSIGYGIKENKDKLLEIKKACRESLKKTSRWINHRGAALRVMAKYYSLTNNRKKAEKYFLKSIIHSRILNKRYELGRSYYEYGQFLKFTGNHKDALREWKNALWVFKEIGASLYVQRCQKHIGSEKEADINEKFGPRQRLRTEKRMSAVLEASRILSSILNLDELLEKIMDYTVESVGAERGILYLYPQHSQERENQRLEIRVVRNVERAELEGEVLRTSKSIIAKVEREMKPLLIQDASQDELLKSQASVVKSGLKSVMCAPIFLKDKLFGIIYIDNHLISGLFTEEDLWVLTVISNQAAISIQNAHLYEEAIKDGLTGLYTHSFFINYLKRQVFEAIRFSKKISLLIIDIDYFKKLNDTYGHQCGDAVLKNVSQIITDKIRRSDIAARYGGDEFVVILSETDINGAKIIADKLRKEVEEQKLLLTNQETMENLTSTITIGAAELQKGDDEIQLIEKADKALYKAKQSGRNCVRIYNQ